MNDGRARRAIGFVTAALALCAAPVARAQDAAATPAPTTTTAPAGELALVWRAPTTCPTSADIQARFTHLVGTLTKHLEATVIVDAPSAGTWSLDLSTVLEGTAGHRVLSGDSCAAVAEAAALILAMMIDPAAAERAATPAPPPPAPPPPLAPPVVVAPPPPLPPTTLRPYARAFAGFLFDALPETTGAAGVAVGAARGHFGAELLFLASREANATLPANAGAGTFRLLAGGARGCGRFGGQSFLGQACLGGEVERIAGQGAGVDSVNAGSVLVGAGTANLTFGLPLLASHVWLTLDLAGAGHPYRPTFFLKDAGDLWRVPGWSAFAGLGLLVII